MINTLYAFISVFIISLVSLIGLVALQFKEKQLTNAIIYLVSFSTGSLLGNAFIHLLPEATKNGFSLNIALYTLGGIITYFIIEKFIRWRHCHVCEHQHTFSVMVLVGDIVHNFIDGLIIGASYLASLQIGVTTTIAVFLHEIPQEIGDFGVLIYGGFTKAKALFYNFLSSLSAVLGVIFVFSFKSLFENITAFLIPFAAGGFIYIATTDLIPELHKEAEPKVSMLQLMFILSGIIIMLLLRNL